MIGKPGIYVREKLWVFTGEKVFGFFPLFLEEKGENLQIIYFYKFY